MFQLTLVTLTTIESKVVIVEFSCQGGLMPFCVIVPLKSDVEFEYSRLCRDRAGRNKEMNEKRNELVAAQLHMNVKAVNNTHALTVSQHTIHSAMSYDLVLIMTNRTDHHYAALVERKFQSKRRCYSENTCVY
jgi:chloramphenicol 3-O-phosphotransferase